MKEERNIITMNEFGNVVMPKDIQATAMSEWELCELFNVTAPTIRAGIKTLCKNGILNECEIRPSDCPTSAAWRFFALKR